MDNKDNLWVEKFYNIVSKCNRDDLIGFGVNSDFIDYVFGCEELDELLEKNSKSRSHRLKSKRK